MWFPRKRANFEREWKFDGNFKLKAVKRKMKFNIEYMINQLCPNDTFGVFRKVERKR